MMSEASDAATSRGSTPFIKVPIVFFFFSSTSMAFERENLNDSPDARFILLGVAPIKHQFTRFLRFFLRLTFFFIVTLIKLPKLVRFNTFFFMLE